MKNITIRNLVGGFLGGFLGIMSGAFIHPIAIPLGCIIGVLVGFWFKEIKLAVVGGLEKTLAAFKTEIDLGFIRNKVQSLANKVRRWSRYHRLTWMRDVRQATRFGYWCLCCLGWIILLPFRLLRLCVSHPVAVARTIRAFSIVSATVIMLIVSYRVFPYWDESERYLLILFVSAAATMLSFLGAEGFMDDDVKTRLPRFFHNWARYSRRGPVLHVATSVAQHLLAMVVMAGMIAIVLFVLFGGVALFVSFVLASLLANALWIASSRHEHLLCVTVTLIVTVTSAILCASYMHGVGLWLVALTAGVLSGLFTEAVRRIVVFAFNNTILYKFLGDVIGDPNRPEELKFGVTKWRIWRWVENLFDMAGQKLVSIMAA